VGIQEWGLAFQCLSLAANQRALNSTTGHWLYIMTDKSFPEIILKFISGSGINIQKNNVVSVRVSRKKMLSLNWNHMIQCVVVYFPGWTNSLSALLQLFTTASSAQ